MVDAATGASRTWKANSLIRDYGDNSAILGLSTDGTNIYGNGFVYNGTGNLEGAFSASPADGTIKWIEDCHGDSYGTYAPSNATDVVYVVSHAHYCGNVGGQPQTNPWSFQRGMAFTKQVTGTLGNNGDKAYFNYTGQPSPSVASWFPELAMATGVCTGFVGDTLTVLDRGRRDIRAALQNWLLVLSLAGAAVAYLIAVLGGFLTAGSALVFAGATAVFLIEDALRRLLMANLRFWRIVAIDMRSSPVVTRAL